MLPDAEDHRSSFVVAVLTCGVGLDTQSRVSSVILVAAGAAFVVLAAIAMVTDHDALSGTFGVLALLAFALAGLAPRMKGEVRAGLNGFRFELVREVVDTGERAGSSDEMILEAVRKALREWDPMAPPPEDDDELDAPFRGTPSRVPAIRSADDLLANAWRAVRRV